MPLPSSHATSTQAAHRDRSAPRPQRTRAGGLRRSAAIALIWLGFAAAPGGPSGIARAQDPLRNPTTAGLPGTAEELEALTSLDGSKYARARRQAEAVLAAAPESIPGLYVLATVHHRGEGNHPRALYLVRKARRLLEAAYGKVPEDPRWQLWHKRLLFEEQWILGEMDERQGQLSLLQYMDEIYRPPEPVRQIWPLLKLRRFEEARQVGRDHLHAPEDWVRERALNGLMAIEDEARNRKASYDWGKRGLEETRGESCIIASNLALAARRCFLFDEAEQYDRIALKADDDSCPTSPYNQLAVIYLLQGKFQQALSAVKELRKVPRAPDLRVQNEMDIRARLTELLFALGQLPAAEDRVSEIVARPDRAGMTSASSENIRLANLTLYAAVMTARERQHLERAAIRGFFGGFDERLTAQRKAAARWEQVREAVKLAAHPYLLVDMVRPYYTDVLPWYSPILIDMLGEGVLAAALREARSVSEDFPAKAHAYLAAFEAELAWRDDDLEETRRLTTKAMEALPAQAVLLRLRLTALRADATQRVGGDATADWQQVLENHPTLLRQLDLAVPVMVASEGSPEAAEAARRMQDSPRVKVRSKAAFEVRFEGSGEGINVCLNSARGTRIHCAEVKASEANPSVDGLNALALAACDAFHDKVLSPRVELTQIDINSLDGRPQRVSASEALKGLVGEK